MLFENIAFAEQLVKSRKTAKTYFLRILSVVGFLVIFIGASVVMSMFLTGDNASWRNVIGSVIAVVGAFGVYFVFKYTDPEFEYTFLDGDMDVVKIYGKMRRKKYFSFTAENVTTIGRMDEKNKAEYSGTFHKKYDVTSNQPKAEKWFIVLDNGRRILFVFEPSEKMLGALHKSIPKRKFLD